MQNINKQVAEERAIRAVMNIMRTNEKDGLVETPLGSFKPNITEFLINKKILMPYEDKRFCIWAPEGKQTWEAFKKAIHMTFIKDSPNFNLHQARWTNIDYITTAMSGKYNFVFKDNIKQIPEWNDIVDKMVISQKDKDNYIVYCRWEFDLDS